MDNQYMEHLRFAIVKQAVIDYTKALQWLRNPPCPHFGESFENEKVQQQRIKEECERFFRGKWYAMLCDIDGEKLLVKARTQSYYGFGKRLRENVL